MEVHAEHSNDGVQVISRNGILLVVHKEIWVWTLKLRRQLQISDR